MSHALAAAPARTLGARLAALVHRHALSRGYSKADSFAQLCGCGAFRYRDAFGIWTCWYPPERLLSVLAGFSSPSRGELWDDLGLVRPALRAPVRLSRAALAVRSADRRAH